MTNTSTSKAFLWGILEDIPGNPMRAARRCRDAFQTSAKAHHEAVHEMIAFIVAFVLHLEQSVEARTEFLEDAHWDGKPQRPKEKNLTRLAAMYMVGAKQSYGALYQQALQYTNVAKHFLEMDIEPEAIPEELRRKPIYQLLDKLDPPQEVERDNGEASVGHGREQPKTAPTGVTVHSGVKHDGCNSVVDGEDGDDEQDDDSDDILGDDEGDLSDDDEDNDNDDADESGGDDNRAAGSNTMSGRDRKTGADAPGVKRAKRYPFKQDRELAVEAEMGWKLFFDRMQPYDEAPVMIRRLPDEDGWAKFEVSDLLSRREFRTTRSGD